MPRDCQTKFSHHRWIGRSLWAIACFAFTLPSFSAPTQPSVSFRREIAPLLLKQCVDCHGPKKSKGGYRLDTFEHLTQTGDSNALPVVAGKPSDSELFRLISTGDDDDRMPKKADPLPDAQIAMIKRWIEQGAAFDGPDKSAPLTSLVDTEHPLPPEIYRQPVPITAIAFSPEGDELAASGYHEITIWEPATGKLLGRIKKLPERIYGVSYSPDGKLLAAACGTPGTLGEVRLCDAAKRSAGKKLDRMTDIVLAVRFSPDGTRLAAGGADNTIRIYGIASGKRELLIEQHADWVTDIAFSPDGGRIASASRDKSARVFDTKTGAMQTAFLGHGEAVTGVAWQQDGKRIYSAGRDRKVNVWNALDGKKYDLIAGFEADPFKLEAAMGCIFASCADGIVRQYSQEDREMICAYPRAEDWIYCIAVDSKHHRVAAGSYGGKVRLWDVEQGKPLGEFVAAPGYAGKAK
jgi:mono/diheme cytochrome c family protein